MQKMDIKVKEIFEKTRNVKKYNQSEKYILPGDENTKYSDRNLSNQKECNKNSTDRNQNSDQQKKTFFSDLVEILWSTLVWCGGPKIVFNEIFITQLGKKKCVWIFNCGEE